MYLDIAKEIYRNATMEKLVLLQMLKRHELARKDDNDMLADRLSERIEVATVSYRYASVRIQADQMPRP